MSSDPSVSQQAPAVCRARPVPSWPCPPSRRHDWGWRGLTDTFDQGARPREVVHHGDHGGTKDAATTGSFTPEFKAEIVELCQRGDRSIGQVARDFDLTETAVREWVRQADVDAGKREGLTSEEKAELAQLRRENRRLKEDVEILKRATAFFAKETR